MTARSSIPQKKWKVERNGAFGLPLRPKNHVCHGTIVERHGTPRFSHASETGLTVSAVAATSMSATPASIRSPAAAAARSGSDAESATRNSTVKVPWVVSKPSSTSSRTVATVKSSAAAYAASRPVVGVTYPILIGAPPPARAA